MAEETQPTNAETPNAGLPNAAINPTAAHASFQKLYDKIADAVQDLTVLNVVTAVGDVTITDKTVTDNDKSEQSRTEQCLNAKAIISRIDLVDGDIQTFMDAVFASDNPGYAKIRDDHVARIKDAHDIVGNNIKALKELVTTVIAILDTTEVQKEKK